MAMIRLALACVLCALLSACIGAQFVIVGSDEAAQYCRAVKQEMNSDRP